MSTVRGTGDSIMNGFSTNTNDTYADYDLFNDDGFGGTNSVPLIVARQGNYDDATNAAVSGYTLSEFPPGTEFYFGYLGPTNATVVAAADPGDVILLEGGINDLGIGADDAQVIAAMQDYGTDFMGVCDTVVLWTIMPVTDDVWFFGENPEKETYRQAINTWVRTEAIAGGYATHVYDPEAMGFDNPADTTLFSDGIHNTRAGYQLHARNIVAVLTGLSTVDAPLYFVGLGVGIRRGSRP